MKQSIRRFCGLLAACVILLAMCACTDKTPAPPVPVESSVSASADAVTAPDTSAAEDGASSTGISAAEDTTFETDSSALTAATTESGISASTAPPDLPGASTFEPAVNIPDTSAPDAAAAYILQTVPAPQYGSVGGEWAVIGLARGGYGTAALFDAYAERLAAVVQAQGGVLHMRKYTEYARVVLALTAIGKDPRDVGGYDLLAPLGDFDRVTFQGLNGAVFALLALDAGDYDVPDAPADCTQATREAYLARILTYAVPGGGFSLDADGDDADADITAMTLCALAPYTADEAVAAAVQSAFAWLSAAQGEDGDYGSAESCAQVLIALASCGIAPDDERFVKNGHSALDALFDYAMPDGGYCHTKGEATANAMASEQALLALVAVHRQQVGTASLYAMEADAKALN